MAPASGAPEFSILIGLVSTEDGDRVLETLAALRRQRGDARHEVLLADRRQDGVSRAIRADYPEATVMPFPHGTSLPQLRAAALEKATGRYVVVTEDHCVPPSDWLESIARAFAAAPPGTVAVGGCVENGVTGSALDWATFLCEYAAFLDPVAEGPVRTLPGMNVAYERSAILSFAPARLGSGFWESTVHPVWLAAGRTLYSTSRIRLLHSKKFSFRHFARQRFLYSRYHGALRFRPGRPLARIVALAATPLLPPLLLYRMFSQVRARRRLRSEFVAALPMLAIFVIIWAWGEMVGYALGEGGALAEIE